MLEIRSRPATGSARVLVLPVGPAAPDGATTLITGHDLAEPLREEIREFLADSQHSGKAGTLHSLPRPARLPSRVLLVGVGDGDRAGWRAAGAALSRAAGSEKSATVLLPADPDEAAAGLAEGLWLGSYRFAPVAGKAERSGWRRITLSTPPTATAPGLRAAELVAEATLLARDLVNTSSLTKSPDWFARQVTRAAREVAHLQVRVLDEKQLEAGGFGGIVAVGAGSARPPRLVELSYRPPGATLHVVLVGKGVTFDTGGISIKPLEAMRLMRKDMGGAAAVVAATLAVARLQNTGVRVTALAPLAENMISGSAMRPGDVVRHYGGLTSEVQNTDAEGRLVLGDALAYAAAKLAPDVLIDLATLTGASHVALGKRTAALFSPSDDLAGVIAGAAATAGERIWRLPLPHDYVPLLTSDVADLTNSPVSGTAGAITAALYLREFAGDCADRWAHIDMSAPAWIETNDGELVKGATGWGVRTLVSLLTRDAAALARCADAG